MNGPFFLRRMFACITLGCATFLASNSTSAHTVPEPAIQAHQMLGPGVWSQVIKLENRNKKSRYPATLYATVFEFDNVLWFYTSTGTQPIERSRNRVDAYRKNLLPLLKNIERGFSSLKIISAGKTFADDTSLAKLENGCVIESIYSLEKVRRAGTEIEKARLLLYSASRNSRRGIGGNARGHAVLIYQTSEGIFYVDPPEISVVKQFTDELSWDPKTFAASIEEPYGKAEISQAFFVPVNEFDGIVSTDDTLYSGDQ